MPVGVNTFASNDIIYLNYQATSDIKITSATVYVYKNGSLYTTMSDSIKNYSRYNNNHITLSGLGAGNYSYRWHFTISGCEDMELSGNFVVPTITSALSTVNLDMYNLKYKDVAISNNSYDTWFMNVNSDSVASGGWITNNSCRFTANKVGTTVLTIKLVRSFDNKVLTTKNITVNVTDSTPTYKVTYNSNGGTGSVSAQSAKAGNTIVITSSKPSREGYTFLGWSKSSTATVATYVSGKAYSFTANTTLYAVWKKVEYSVTYNMNGGTGSVPKQTKYYGVNLYLSTVIPEKKGYVFKGWAKTSTASVVLYKSGQIYDKNENIVLYAVWEDADYTITYSANGGQNPPAAQTFEFGKAATITKETPTKSGYDFLGWGTSAVSTEVKYKSGEEDTIDKDITLYAIWEKIKYTLNYNLNGGFGTIESFKFNEGDMVIITSVKPTKDGAVFLGWNLDKTSSKVIYQPGSSYSFNTSTTLYAVWKSSEYIITYNANGGTGVPSPQTKIHGIGVTLSFTGPVKAGYQFIGWGLSPDGEVIYNPGQSYNIDEDVTLYAIWSKEKMKQYTITYNSNGGTGTFESQYKLEGKKTYISFVKPSREGYVFLGWGISSYVTYVSYMPGDEYNDDKDIILYAIWEKQVAATEDSGNYTGDGNDSNDNKATDESSKDKASSSRKDPKIKVITKNLIVPYGSKVYASATCEEDAELSFLYYKETKDIATIGTDGLIYTHGYGTAKMDAYVPESDKYKKSFVTFKVKVIPTAGEIISVKSPKKGRLSIKIKSNKDAAGYQYAFYYSKNKGWLTKNFDKTTFSGKLKRKKRYSVKVRTYVIVNGKKIYGDWSKVKKIKIK